MNETKEKIQEMIKQEKAEKRREELEAKRKKKKGKQPKEEKSPLSDGKKKLYRSLFFIALFLLMSFGLFYGAGVIKKSVENKYQMQLETDARKTLQALMTQAILTLSHKINNLNYILRDAEYIKNFNNPSWQSILKTELSALLGEQAVIAIVPENFSEEEVIDNKDMGYAVLSILNELKKTSNTRSANHLRVEVHRANTENARLMMIRKVTYYDVEQKEDVAIGYIVASLAPMFMDQLLKDFKPNSGYVEIVQKFAGKKSVLSKKGDATLAGMPMMVEENMNNTEWTFQFWPAAQRDELPASKFWQALVYLGLGSLAFVSALVLLIAVINKYRQEINAVLPHRQVSKSKKPPAATKEVTAKVSSVNSEMTDVLYSKSNGIAVEDEDVSQTEYLSMVVDNIFRAYDIRGVVGEFINAEIFRSLAFAIGKEMSELKQTRIAIGYDGRNSSPELFQALKDALVESGMEVLDIGMVSSPILYFAAITKADGNGIIVTASHNTADYNGMKIMLAGHSYHKTHLDKLKKRVLNEESVSGTGSVTEMNVMEDYFNKITGNVILARPMNIVIDCGNGVTGKYAQTFFEKMGCKVTTLNAEVDGNFPGHLPDPSRPENLSGLIQAVSEVKADVGIAFDGDGDRIGLVSSGGEIIWPDRILMLLAKDILSRNKDATVIYDIKSTGKLEPFIREQGGMPLIWKSGHSFMKSKLLETGAILAGEMSGHIFIKDRWYGFDDALFAAARILEILSIDLRKSRQVFAELPDSLNTPEILVTAEHAQDIIDKITSDTSQFGDGKIITIDGIRVEYPDGWGLVRASNTSENLTLRFEADNEEALQRIANQFKVAVLTAAPSLTFPF